MPRLDQTAVSQIFDKDESLQHILDAGINLFQLRYRRRSEWPIPVHGFDDVDVQMNDNPRGGLSYRIRPRQNSYAEFTPDKRGILTAYVPDIPKELAPQIYGLSPEPAERRRLKNRRQLASHLYSGMWDIVRYYTKDGEVPVLEIIAEIKKLAIEEGYTKEKTGRDEVQKVEVMGPASTSKKEVTVAGPEIKKQQVMGPPPNALAPRGPKVDAKEKEGNLPPSPRELSTAKMKIIKKEAEKEVFVENKDLIRTLKKQSKGGWRLTKIFKQTLLPLIETRTKAKQEEAINVNQDPGS